MNIFSFEAFTVSDIAFFFNFSELKRYVGATKIFAPASICDENSSHISTPLSKIKAGSNTFDLIICLN